MKTKMAYVGSLVATAFVVLLTGSFIAQMEGLVSNTLLTMTSGMVLIAIVIFWFAIDKIIPTGEK